MVYHYSGYWYLGGAKHVMDGVITHATAISSQEDYQALKNKIAEHYKMDVKLLTISSLSVLQQDRQVRPNLTMVYPRGT